MCHSQKKKKVGCVYLWAILYAIDEYESFGDVCVVR